MAKKIATLYADIQANTANLQKGLKESKTGLAKLGDSFKSVTGLSFGAVAAFGAVAKVLGDSVKAAMEADKVNAVTAATIKATGRSAYITSDQIGDLALAESRLTSIDDEVVQSGVNMLLTFRGLGEEVLPRATRAMEDMAVAMSGGDTSAIDLKGTAIQLGKALNDPVTGLTALRKVGITFSDEQQQQIKDFMAVNDLASAQGVILSELEGEFGGLSAAMGDTAAGGVQKLKNEWGNLLEVMGQPLMGGKASVVDILTKGLINTSDTVVITQQLNKLMAFGLITQKQYKSALQGLQYKGGDDFAKNLIASTDEVYQNLTRLGDAASNTFVFAPDTKPMYETISALEAEADALEASEKAWKSYESAQDSFNSMADEQKKYLEGTGNEIADLLGDKMSQGSDKYVAGLGAIDEAMGTTLTQEYEHKEAVKALAAEYAKTGDIDKFKEGMENLKDIELKDLNENMIEAANTAERLYAVWAKMQGLPTTLQWKVEFETEQGILTSLNSGKGNIPGQVTMKKEASGGDFIVPPGFTGDSYNVGVTSGERVSVTPVGQTGAAGMTVYGDIYVTLPPDKSTVAGFLGELQGVMA